MADVSQRSSYISETVYSDSKLTVSDECGQGAEEYRANELYDPNRWDHFSKKTDVYAIGIILEKMVRDS